MQQGVTFFPFAAQWQLSSVRQVRQGHNRRDQHGEERREGPVSSDGLFLEHAHIFGTRPTMEHAVLLAITDHLADRCTVLMEHAIFARGSATTYFGGMRHFCGHVQHAVFGGMLLAHCRI